MTIPSLIDKVDNFELIRDQIAGILATESTSQQALAVAASQDPNDYKLRVYTERANPFENWLNSQVDKSPIVNVTFSTTSFPGGVGDVVERQKAETTYYIDCFGLGVAAETATGHNPGDELAAQESHRAARLVRNILMSSEYTFLALRGLVWSRWPQSITSEQIQFNANNAVQVVVTRLGFVVEYNEFSPQAEPVNLNYVAIDFKRASDGMLIAEADFDYS